MPERVVDPADEDIEPARSPRRDASAGGGIADGGGRQEFDGDVAIAAAVEGPCGADIVEGTEDVGLVPGARHEQGVQLDVVDAIRGVADVLTRPGRASDARQVALDAVGMGDGAGSGHALCVAQCNLRQAGVPGERG